MLVGYIMSSVCLRWDEFSRLTFCSIWGCMCWTGSFEFRWLKGHIYNPSNYHHQIGSIHLSHCCHIFPWLCVWDGCTTIFCHLLHIYLGNTGTLLYPPLQRSWKGGILVSPCPSVRLWTESCPLCIFNNNNWILFIFVHLIKQLQMVCRL